MSWTPGYVRLDDRVAAPHSALRGRPAFAVRDLARTMARCVEAELRQTELTTVDVALLLVAITATGRAALEHALTAVERRRATSAACARRATASSIPGAARPTRPRRHTRLLQALVERPWYRIRRGAFRIRMSRAGTPPTTALAGMSFVTTAFVPITALSPTVTPRRMPAP
jgi:hypothetical protein